MAHQTVHRSRGRDPVRIAGTGPRDRGERGGHSFDADGAEFTHRDGKCTFEVLVEDFSLTSDPGVERLARVVHAADIKGELANDPLAPGLLAIAHGALEVEDDDYRLLERESFVYDALYAWARSNPDRVTP
jgi:hypothetical protein